MVKAKKELAVADKTAATGQDSRWVLDGMTPEQAAECEAIKAKIKARPRRPNIQFKTAPEGGRTLIAGDPEKQGNDVLNSVRLYGAMGSSSDQFIHSCLTRITAAARVTGNDHRDTETVGAAMAFVSAVAPEDELEATMAIQMVAANDAALMFFDRARSAEFLEHATAFSNMANKAMRSFALHAEALAKMRRNGEQVVKHVHVNDGGQAVIAGTVNTGGGGRG